MESGHIVSQRFLLFLGNNSVIESLLWSISHLLEQAWNGLHTHLRLVSSTTLWGAHCKSFPEQSRNTVRVLTVDMWDMCIHFRWHRINVDWKFHSVTYVLQKVHISNRTWCYCNNCFQRTVYSFFLMLRTATSFASIAYNDTEFQHL